MPDVFITMKEAAEFEGVKYGTFAQRIARNPKQYKTRTQPQENGGKEQVLVSVDSLTAKGRKAWRAAQKIDGRDVVIEKRTESAPWYVGVDLNHYTEQQMMRAVARKIIAQEYPHAKSPAVVYATVSKATQLGETFDLEDLVIHNDETGSSFKGHITAHWNEYTLTVVDRWGNEDESFPPLPGVRSKGQYKAGAFVAVAMAYGDSPAIIGEVQL